MTFRTLQCTGVIFWRVIGSVGSNFTADLWGTHSIMILKSGGGIPYYYYWPGWVVHNRLHYRSFGIHINHDNCWKLTTQNQVNSDLIQCNFFYVEIYWHYGNEAWITQWTSGLLCRGRADFANWMHNGKRWYMLYVEGGTPGKNILCTWRVTRNCEWKVSHRSESKWQINLLMLWKDEAWMTQWIPGLLCRGRAEFANWMHNVGVMAVCWGRNAGKEDDMCMARY